MNSPQHFQVPCGIFTEVEKKKCMKMSLHMGPQCIEEFGAQKWKKKVTFQRDTLQRYTLDKNEKLGERVTFAFSMRSVVFFFLLFVFSRGISFSNA